MTALNLGIDIGLLDVNLNGEGVFPVADELLRTGVPFAFITAYVSDVFPKRYQSALRIEKPVDPSMMFRTLQGLAVRALGRSP